MKIDDWGLIEYGPAVERQLALIDEIASGQAEERIVVCTHPPTVTLGRATEAGDLAGWTGPIFESTRGGRATYHGPNQVVIYPLVNLGRRNRDVHAYLRKLEEILIGACAELGLNDCYAEATGVWKSGRKVASIGIAVRKWITYHGVALNVLDDPQAFQGIRPCGYSADVMSSLEREGIEVDYAIIRAKVAQRIAVELMNWSPHLREPDSAIEVGVR